MIKPSTNGLGQQPLEQVLPAKPELRFRQLTLKSVLAYLWKALIGNLKESPEVRVWYTRDRAGKIWWSAYDPTTRRSIHQISEAEMRTWIEQCYH
jgi:hypothetical protein